MYVDIREITKAVAKISDMVAGDKTVPGILFRLSKDETDEDGTLGLLQVCYTDGHKSLVEELKVVIEESDFIGDAAVSYEQFTSALSNYQSHGKIEIDTFRIEYFPDTFKLSANQYVSYPDETGESTLREKMGTKYIDISRFSPTDNAKAKILIRTKYDAIFTGEQLDEYERTELIDMLSRTSTEKGKLIYIAPSRQEVLVANQAHAVACSISKYEITEDDKALIKEELLSQGITDEKAFEDICTERTNRAHHSLVIYQQMAKSLIGVLSKLVSDKVYIERVDKFCNLFVDNEDEKVGILFEMPAGSKVHLNLVQQYSGLPYKTYQMTFLKDLIEDAVKQALNTTKSDQLEFAFETVENEETGRLQYEMVIVGGSASASTSNTSRSKADDVVDSLGDLTQRKLNISLRVLLDMLNQIKTDTVAFDVSINENGVTYLRIAEINARKQAEQYKLMREDLDPETPTPIERKLEARDKVLGVREFTILSK